jgi:hypothetical protein
MDVLSAKLQVTKDAPQRRYSPPFWTVKLFYLAIKNYPWCLSAHCIIQKPDKRVRADLDSIEGAR